MGPDGLNFRNTPTFIMLPNKIYLIDIKEDLCAAWQEVFSDIESVKVECTDFFSRPADAMVSPANSFGIMDGGLDKAIRATLKGSIQKTVQDRILERHYGELPIGSAEIVETEDERWPYLIVAPTMRIPENVSHTINAYLAFRAILVSIIMHNRALGVADIDTVIVPGLGTLTGVYPPERCAYLMRMAFNSVSGPAGFPSWDGIHATHQKLTTGP